MIDTFKETILSVDEAAKHVSKIAKKKRSRPVIMRWANRGVAGVKLATILIGGEIYTSAEALNRFMNESRAAKLAKQGQVMADGIANARAKQQESEANMEPAMPCDRARW